MAKGPGSVSSDSLLFRGALLDGRGGRPLGYRGPDLQEDLVHKWTELEGAPSMPPSLPPLPDNTGTWWRAESDPELCADENGPRGDGGQHGHETYVHVSGDGKAGAIYVLTIYTVPFMEWEEGVGERVGARAQYPTIPELWHIMTEFALAGAMFSIMGPYGPHAFGVSHGSPPDRLDGYVLQIVQTGCEAGSPADRRFKLTAVTNPPGIISIAGARP